MYSKLTNAHQKLFISLKNLSCTGYFKPRLRLPQRAGQLDISGHNCVKTILLSLLGIFSIMLAPIAWGAASGPSSYQFEIVIYSKLNQQSLQSEDWPYLQGNLTQSNGGTLLLAPSPDSQATAAKNKAAPPTDGQGTNPQAQTATQPEVAATTATTANPAGNDPNQTTGTTASAPTLQLITTDNYLIPAATLDKLRQHGYKIVLQAGWVQPSAQLDRTTHLHLLGGQSYPSNTDQSNATNTLGAITTSTTPQNPSTYQVNGDIAISLNRFFNFKFNLLFTEPTASLQKIDRQFNRNNQWGQWSYFHLYQRRRMRSGELNYIDHPLYGILVMIKPIDNTGKDYTDKN